MEKMAFTMSDRAANKKTSNWQLEKWHNMLEKCSSSSEKQSLHHFYCMAQVLLGFHSYAMRELNALQKIMEEKGSQCSGRDKLSVYNRFGKQTICQRTHMTSEIIGPMGDEKNGIQDNLHIEKNEIYHAIIQ